MPREKVVDRVKDAKRASRRAARLLAAFLDVTEVIVCVQRVDFSLIGSLASWLRRFRLLLVLITASSSGA